MEGYSSPDLTIQLSRDQARRFLVLHHGLAPPRSLPARPESVLTVIERLGVLQFDPLEVPGARNHDLVLHARIAGYRREWCERWLYGADRRLFEIYNKSLNIVPIAELPHYRYQWLRHSEGHSAQVLREHADSAGHIIDTISERGPQSTASFAHLKDKIDWWWASTRVGRAVLEALFVSGRVGVARREGNKRFFDLIERLVPAELLARSESEEDAQRHRLLSRFRAVGLATPAANAEVIVGTGTASERQRRTAEMVDAGALVPVDIEGMKGPRYVIAEELALLDGEPYPGDPTGEPAVAFIAPLDPLIWDRRLLRDLFAFDYVWEVYVPQHRRRWGYYVMPILFGDRLVGRIEPRFDRRSGTLHVLGLAWEDGFTPRTAEGFVPAMRAALKAYARFVGARAVEWAAATGTAGRTLGPIIRRG